MKKCLMIVVFINMSISFAQNINVVEYYRLLPDTLLDNSKYELYCENGVWKSTSCADYEIEPIVDIENGYLRICDEGTGGGITWHEMRVFQVTSDKKIIGVVITNFDGLGFNGSLNFYKYESKSWYDITSEVIPAIDYRMFLDENFVQTELDDTDKRFLDDITVVYSFVHDYTTADLPTSDMNVYATVSAMYLEMKIEYTDEYENTEQLNAAQAILKNIKYKRIKLKWDSNVHEFTIAKKIE